LLEQKQATGSRGSLTGTVFELLCVYRLIDLLHNLQQQLAELVCALLLPR
jgi:hypothetical protein